MANIFLWETMAAGMVACGIVSTLQSEELAAPGTSLGSDIPSKVSPVEQPFRLSGQLQSARESSNFSEPVTILRLSTNGEHVGWYQPSRGIRILDVHSRKQLVSVVPNRDNQLAGFDLTPDGQICIYAIANSAQANILVRKVNTGKILQRIPLSGLAPSPSMPTAIALSPDAGRVAGAFQGNPTRVWKRPDAREQVNLGTNPGSSRVRFSSDGKQLAIGNDRQWVEIWKLDDAKRLQQIGRSETGGVTSFSWSPDSRYLATTTFYGIVCMWDANNGGLVHCIDVNQSKSRRVGTVTLADGTMRDIIAGEATASCLSFSGDGRTLAVGYSDGKVRVYEVMTGQERSCFRVGENCSSLSLSSRGDVLVTGGRDGSVNLWKWEHLSLNTSKNRDVQLWEELADEDAAIAYQAMTQLVSLTPERLEQFYRGLPRTVFGPDLADAQKWMSQLASGRFRERDEANRRLHRIRYWIEKDLRVAWSIEISPEAKTRLKDLINALENSITDPEWIRLIRFVELLEFHRTPESIKILRDLAERSPRSRLTIEAKAALSRLCDM